MNLFSKLTVAALIAATVFSSPAYADNSYEAHQELLIAINEVGVRTRINPNKCFSSEYRGVNGFYNSSAAILGICQDHATRPNTEVPWTDNDYDTLRHESIHLVQDMLDGVGDDSLPPIIKDRDLLGEFVMDTIGPEKGRSIVRSYSQQGAPINIIHVELEAFSFASELEASDITKLLRAK